MKQGWAMIAGLVVPFVILDAMPHSEHANSEGQEAIAPKPAPHVELSTFGDWTTQFQLGPTVATTTTTRTDGPAFYAEL